ncbi:hypothetical protein [Oceanibacterium hippocampi]|uniref:Uncharacterized protein n=1 Tax=Oceanibacterium hippocampi TaxID=745714 RepID=A0A1Y5TCD2_9PROT|nr:hypothetical protein [Oceanibacterium hippocampi]SLN60535.1 hypothetical protein OCH7691_02666 [Oceanibacterium hippocampi]
MASKRGFLDSILARAISFLVFLGLAGVIFVIAQDRIMGSQAEAAGPNEAAFVACLHERRAAIDKELADGVYDARQAETFLSRAEAYCRSTTASE